MSGSRAIDLAAAAATTYLLARLAIPGEALSGALPVAPWIALALGWIGDAVVRRDGRRLQPAISRVELFAFASLLTAAAARPLLGGDPTVVAIVGPTLAAGLAALLLHRAGRLLIAARPLLVRAPRRRPSWVFFALPLVVYLGLLPWQSARRAFDGDEPYYLLLAHSLAYDGDVDLADNYEHGDAKQFLTRPLAPQPGDPTGPGGEQYSRHNAPLPLLLAPAYRFGGALGAQIVLAILTALSAWGTLALARALFPRRAAAARLAYGLLAGAPPLLYYSYQIWAEVPAAALVVLGLSAARSPAAGGRPARRATAALLFAAVALPLLKIRFLALSVGLLAVAALHPARRRSALTIAALGVGLTAGGLMLNRQLFGNPLKYHDPAALAGVLGPPAAYLTGLAGLLFDCAFGLFAAAPLWLLLVPAVLRLARGDSAERRFLGQAAVLSAPYLLLVAPRVEWYGGWGPPFRYAIVLLPVAALALVPLAAERRGQGRRLLVVGLGLATVATTLLAVAHPGWVYSLADGRSTTLDGLFAGAGLDVARFFPSYVRPRAATLWWPAVALVVVAGLWRVGGHRRRSYATIDRWAGCLVLALTAALLLAARYAPTRRIELEDPHVAHAGGRLYPERWRPARVAYRGGWLLTKGSEVSVRPNLPLGSRRTLELTVALRPQRAAAGATWLELRRGDATLARASIPSGDDWIELELPAVEWHPGDEPLRLGLAPAEPRRRPQVILDWATLAWR